MREGKYIKLLCADDVIYSDCLQAQVNVLENPANNSISVVFCRRDIIDPNGKRLMTWGYPGRPGRRSGTALLRKCLHYSSNLLGEPMCRFVCGAFYCPWREGSKELPGSATYIITPAFSCSATATSCRSRIVRSDSRINQRPFKTPSKENCTSGPSAISLRCFARTLASRSSKYERSTP